MIITHKSTSGFTLIELMVVIAIIGLLASTVLGSMQSARVRGQDAQRISEVRELMKSLELYRNTNNGYPCSGTGFSGSAAAFNCTPAALSANLAIEVKFTTAPSAAAGFFRTAVGFQPGLDPALAVIQYHVGISSGTTANRNGYFIRVELANQPACIVQAGNAAVPAAWSALTVCTSVKAI